MSISLSAFVMAYNEASSLPDVVGELDRILGVYCKDYEIVVIDDGSTDATGEVANKLASTLSCCRVVHHETNQGLGGVYRTAFCEARQDALYFVAADGQSDPETIVPLFLPKLLECDVVLGVPRKRKDPLLSRMFTFGERVVFAGIFPGVPKIGGPCMFRRSLLTSLPLLFMEDRSREWIVLWELIVRAKQAGCRMEVCDIKVRPRRHGGTKASTWRNAVHMLISAFRLKWMLLKGPNAVRISVDG